MKNNELIKFTPTSEMKIKEWAKKNNMEIKVYSGIVILPRVLTPEEVKQLNELY